MAKGSNDLRVEAPTNKDLINAGRKYLSARKLDKSEDARQEFLGILGEMLDHETGSHQLNHIAMQVLDRISDECSDSLARWSYSI